VEAAPGGTAKFLRADGTWQPPPGGGGAHQNLQPYIVVYIFERTA
jgi:hypothetical protein